MTMLALRLLFIVQACLAHIIVKTENGKIRGVNSQAFKQDFFLGIPYAAPPVGSLRFANPEPFNETWDDIRLFDHYGDACISTGNTGNLGLNQSEDCLTLNVVRPHGHNYKDLPVAIWIHGGSFIDGSSSAEAFNLSYIVQNSVEIDRPIIAVSLNYRLGGFGFLNADAVIAKNWTNVGLRDQLAAIEWVHNNIENFGGDPNHLVIWGESAGAMSIGYLLNSGLLGDYIQGAIMESGTSMIQQTGYAGLQENDYQALVKYFNCSGDNNNNNNNSLTCLQHANVTELQYVFNATNEILPGYNYVFPYLDGQIIPRSGYKTLSDGNFTQVPILIGTNTDEGTSFLPPTIQTQEEILGFIHSTFPLLQNDSISKVFQLYPSNDTSLHTPLDPTYNTSEIVFPLGYNTQLYPVMATFATDVLFAGPTRILAEKFVNQSLPVYKYRFNIPDLTDSEHPWTGVGHYREVVYVMDNPNNLTAGAWVESTKASNISSEVSKHWISFISDLDPNYGYDDDDDVEWPEYGETSQNKVFDLNGFYIEDDTWREKQIQFLESIHNQLNY